MKRMPPVWRALSRALNTLRTVTAAITMVTMVTIIRTITMVTITMDISTAERPPPAVRRLVVMVLVAWMIWVVDLQQSK